MSEPEVYGKYRLVRKIASGGMAEVLLARSSSIGGFEKILAIKRMHPKLSRHQGFVSLFIEEAKLWVALNHPNIVQVFDFGKVDDNYYIAMEFVDGLDLAFLAGQARLEGQALDPAAVLYIMKHVFDGMAYAHHKRDHTGKPAGVIHRDISPHNILVSFEGQIKISDFGIAKAAEELARESKGEIVGKVAYISPEQALGEVITQQADIWSGGVILHELLTNKRLFSRNTDQETLDALSNHSIESVLDYNPDLPPALDSLVRHILDRNINARAKSAREVAEGLNDILAASFPRMSEFKLSEIIQALLKNSSPSMLNSLEGSQGPKFAQRNILERTQLLTKTGIDESQLSATDLAQIKDQERIRESIERIKVTFTESPSLWGLVDIAGLYFDSDNIDLAIAGYELAAAKFMQKGLLVQALAIYTKLTKLIGITDRIITGVRRLPSLVGLDHSQMCQALISPDHKRDFAEYLKLLELDTDEYLQAAEIIRAPILGELEADQLEYIFRGMSLVEAESGYTIVKEGDSLQSFFWVGRGRVIMSTMNFANQRVYLTSLSDGDCFGEQSFFSGLPRESNVEAAEDSWILVIAKPLVDQLMTNFPPVLETLREFYKARIAESLIARSELLGSMSFHYRKRLAEQFTFFDIAKGALIINEGEASDACYAIKSGQVEVFSQKDEEAVVLATLGPGEIFGEIAALKGITRTASVRALTRCEILRLQSTDLKNFLAKNTDIQEKIEVQIENRADETARLFTSKLLEQLAKDE